MCKRWMLAGVLLLSVSACAQSRKPDQLHTLPEGELGMIKVMLAQERAWNAGDLDGFLSGYKHSPETRFIGANSIEKGFETIAEHYRRSYPDAKAMGMLTFSGLEPHLLDERHGYLVGMFKLERPKKLGGNAEGVFTLVMEKTPEGWKIVLDHTT